MGPGTYISAIGHVGLVGWLAVGLTFAPRHPEPEVTSVTLVSADVFNLEPTQQVETPVVAETQASQIETPTPDPTPAPEPEIAPEAPVQPEPTPAPQTPSQPAPAPAPEPAPTVEPAPEPQPAPEPAPAPEPTPEPEPAPAPEVATFVAPETTMRPVPRPAERVADQDVEGETDPTATVAEVADAQVATATEIVTDAQTPSGAPTTAPRPQARPVRTAAATPAPETTPTADPAPQAADDSAVAAALAEAMAGGSQTPAAPEPLTSAELQGLQLQMHCWNVGSLSTDALASKIVVAVDLTRDGRPVPSSIQLIETLEGTRVGADQAFEAARRGILECGAEGFDLPTEKYEFWRSLELVFNPESMRAK